MEGRRSQVTRRGVTRRAREQGINFARMRQEIYRKADAFRSPYAQHFVEECRFQATRRSDTRRGRVQGTIYARRRTVGNIADILPSIVGRIATQRVNAPQSSQTLPSTKSSFFSLKPPEKLVARAKHTMQMQEANIIGLNRCVRVSLRKDGALKPGEGQTHEEQGQKAQTTQ